MGETALATLLDVARWLELTNVKGMANKLGLGYPISVSALIKKVVQDADGIKHIFVLMLENRSFDHMLGFAGVRGRDAVTSQPTQATDLSTITLRTVARALQETSVRAMASKRGLSLPISARALIQSIHSNVLWDGTRLFARTPADFKIPHSDGDPDHEFFNVLNQF